MIKTDIISQKPGSDYQTRIKTLREKLNLTQEVLAEKLGVSFATINRWENQQTKPSQLYWNQLRNLELKISEPTSQYRPADKIPSLDFTAEPDAIKILAEGERLSFGHLMNPAFATEISSIDPLPHQRIAVYENMLTQSPLRFLLADDAGAGKTIMTGLYIREMLSRRLLKRILIVPPAGLVGNWRRELSTLFNLQFKIVTGPDFRNANPFINSSSEHLIISIDTLATPRVFSRLNESEVLPYDLVVFDEAHKLSADRGADLRIRKTDRYCLAEAIAGLKSLPERWKLKWHAQHLLLLTATPHMGKEYPYYALWRLLLPEMLPTLESFAEFPVDRKQQHFIRRSKEEMLYLDGSSIFTQRVSNTHGYQLSQGDISEQKLYDETTIYLREVYNKAKLLNREAARLAMGVFQRRLASSTFALLCSFDRRIEKLKNIIQNVQDGKITSEQLIMFQQRLADEHDVLDEKTADEETTESGKEENELVEENILQGVIAVSLADLIAERETVIQLRDLAKRVYEAGTESKFDKLREFITDPKYTQEKLIVFTEHRDTLRFLTNRLNGLGFTNQIAQIHGGMDYSEREHQVEFFRKPVREGGARFLVCTDAAGEGINLQFCWIMINYDVPWNPARLEQRMGRIHRYLQTHDPVLIVNLVAPSTREGQVLSVLLEKLEKIRKELRSDKVFDCVGRLFEGVSLKRYMELAITQDAEVVAQELEGKLTVEQIKALEERERHLFGSGGDVKSELPRLRESLENEVFFRLMPGYVSRYIQQAAPLVDLKLGGDCKETFTLHPKMEGAIDPLLSALEYYPEKAREKLSVYRLKDHYSGIWLHPGEPVFERFRQLVSERLGDKALRGAIFVDPITKRPYLFHLALITIIRKADPAFEELNAEEPLECRLIGIKQYEGSELETCPIEHLLLLKGGKGIPPTAQRIAVHAKDEVDYARSYLAERVARELALTKKSDMLQALPERENFVNRGFDFQEAELASARAKHSEPARAGNRKAREALEEVKINQQKLAERRARAIAVLQREPELIMPGQMTFITHALVVSSSDPDDIKQVELNIELEAMKIAQAYEEASGATVKDVHSPELARSVGLSDYPGFDLLSLRQNGEKRCIEVKGRSSVTAVELLDNEWSKACNLRERYWLYTVYNCATPTPKLYRVQDPFGNLFAKDKGGVLINPSAIIEAAVDNE
jgi:SNF2 family DNA or RNA helicase